MDGQVDVVMRPIGRVVAGRPSSGGGSWEDTDCQVEIADEWRDALDGLEGFSHIWLLWCLDRLSPPSSPKVHPERRQDLPEVGLFATRSPQRPNPIAMTAVRLVERQGSVLRVRGLDAFEGTPILDVKPYLRRGDSIPEAVMPDWIEALWRRHDAERGLGPDAE